MSQLEEQQHHLGGAPYKLLKAIGEGAMGAVYLAEHTRLGHQVVVKVMHPHVGGSADRLRLEAQALAKLRHDNIVQVSDFGTTVDERPFLVMEYLQGQPLDEHVAARGGWLPSTEVVSLARQALSGLSVVHEAGIVHRDLKPSNLFVCTSGRLKLLDFGIIKLLEDSTGIAPLAQPTRAGMAVGTPKYMSPEQATGKQITPQTDLYAIGAVIYFMISGRSPFEHHNDVTSMLKAHLMENAAPPSSHAHEPISPRLDAVVLRALAKNPADRYPSALAMAGELYTLGSGFQQLSVELGLDQMAGGDQASAVMTPGAGLGAAQQPSPQETMAAMSASAPPGQVTSRSAVTPAPALDGPTMQSPGFGAAPARNESLASTVAFDADQAPAGFYGPPAGAVSGTDATAAAPTLRLPEAGSGAAPAGPGPMGAHLDATAVSPPRPGGVDVTMGDAWSDSAGRKIFWLSALLGAAMTVIVMVLVGWGP